MFEKVCECDGPDCEICFIEEGDNLEEDNPDDPENDGEDSAPKEEVW